MYDMGRMMYDVRIPLDVVHTSVHIVPRYLRNVRRTLALSYVGKKKVSTPFYLSPTS